VRILMISALYPPVLSGVANHVADISAALAAKNHKVTCLCGSDIDADDSVNDNLTIRRRQALQPVALKGGTATAWLADIQSYIADSVRDFDFIHCHNAHLYAGAIADLAFSQAGRLPLINTVHDHFGQDMRADVLCREWDRLIYVSDFVRARLPSLRPSLTQHLGIDLNHFTPYGPSEQRLMTLERPVICHPARLLPWKGTEVGLEAFIQLRARLGRGTLVLTSSDTAGVEASVPQDMKRKLQDKARLAGIFDNVAFVDVEHANLPSAMRACDLIWYPTTGEEPFGLTPLEAMACGIPVIVTDSGGMAETIVPGSTGLVVPRWDYDALAKSAYFLLTNQAEQERVVQSALRSIGNFSLDFYVERLSAIYSSSAT
jgi:glycosyltransferase involved in cell wall biosynthesis